MEKKRKIVIAVFLATETAICLNFLFFPFFGLTNAFQFASIALCFVLLLSLRVKKGDWLLVVTAMGFTLVSNVFLVLLQGFRLLATASFCLVQFIYAIRLRMAQEAKNRGWFQFRIGGFLLLEALGYWIVGEAFDLLSFLVLLSFSTLLVNIAQSFGMIQKQFLFFLGLVFLSCCDVVIGLANSTGYLVLPDGSFGAWLISLPLNVAWLFYLPSQVLITLSVYFPRLSQNPVGYQGQNH